MDESLEETAEVLETPEVVSKKFFWVTIATLGAYIAAVIIFIL